MTITLDWRGGMVRRRMSKVVANGMDKTMAQAVNYAKPTAPVLTGAYQGSIAFRPSKVSHDGNVRGEWGSHSINYAIYIENRKEVLGNAARRAYPKFGDNVRREAKRLGF